VPEIDIWRALGIGLTALGAGLIGFGRRGRPNAGWFDDFLIILGAICLSVVVSLETYGRYVLAFMGGLLLAWLIGYLANLSEFRFWLENRKYYPSKADLTAAKQKAVEFEGKLSSLKTKIESANKGVTDIRDVELAKLATNEALQKLRREVELCIKQYIQDLGNKFATKEQLENLEQRMANTYQKKSN
jgi:hypothetical protein